MAMKQIVGPLLQRAAAQLGGPQTLQRALAGVLERATRRALGVEAEARIDVVEGAIAVVVFRVVVEHPSAPDEIGLAQARLFDCDAELGDELACLVDLDGLAPFLEGALVVSAEQYAPLRTLLADLMWDREVLAAVPQTVPDPREAVPQLVDALQRSPFARWLRPGCDSYELEAHAMMLGRPLPRELRTLLGAIGGMEAAPLAPTLTLAGHGYRLLGPGEAQQQHAEWTRRRDDPQQQAGGTTHPAQAWDTDWLPVALGSRGTEPAALLVIDPRGSAAARPGQLLSVSFEDPGFWVLGLDLAGLAHVWH
ncbi:MAG: hypothetical protein KDK70_35040, partial [Myxococcales bacterium]|nr:hypothetical protein [Myxococcales bacterium]